MAATVIAVSLAGVWRLLAFVAFWLTAAGMCAATEDYQPQFADKPAAAAPKEQIFAVYPLHNPERLHAAYAPLAEYLSAHVPGVHFRLEASRSYGDFERKIEARHAHFLLCNPRQIVLAVKHGYHVFAKSGGDADHYGIILVRSDSAIQNVSDLKGKKVSFPAPGALAGTMLPQYYLHSHGLDVRHDLESTYVGSQESSILSVYHRVSAAGATWMAPWKQFQALHPEIARALVIKWRTEPLPDNGVAVRDDVPVDLAEQVAALLLRLGDDDAGRAALAAIPAPGFERASAETYASTVEFLRRFNAEIRMEPE
jgi:phosphonate transport system substrate-binding protein